MPDPRPEVLDFLLTRRSRPAKTLGATPIPREQVEVLLTAAARTPDHGKLVPWRFIVMDRDQDRDALAVSARTHLESSDLANDKIDKAVNAFGQGAVIVAVVATPKAGGKIPVWEQELSAGAVCLALVNAALAAGHGANWLTGPLARDHEWLGPALGCAADEFVAGFIHIGDEKVVPSDRDRPDLKEIVEWR